MLYPACHKLNKEHGEYESDLLSNEHHLSNSENKAWKMPEEHQAFFCKYMYFRYLAFIYQPGVFVYYLKKKTTKCNKPNIGELYVPRMI